MIAEMRSHLPALMASAAESQRHPRNSLFSEVSADPVMKRELWEAAPDEPALSDAEVHVWRVRVDRPLVTENLSHELSKDEVIRAERIGHAQHRQRFICTRSATRVLLGRYLSCDPRTLAFALGPHGKPYIAGRRIRFNASHSSEWAIIGVTLGAEIGVDVENLARRTNVERVAPRVLTSGELEQWQALPEADRRTEFFRLWVAKEAYIKAVGAGLSIDPQTVDTSKIDAREIDVAPGYRAAIVVLVPGAFPVRQFEFGNAVLP